MARRVFGVLGAWVAGSMLGACAGDLASTERDAAERDAGERHAPECYEDADCGEERVCEEARCIQWWKLHGEAPELPPQEVLALVERGEVQILDVRTPAEFRRGHIPGAVSVPLGALEEAADDLPLDPNRPVVAVCLTAHRSIAAVRLLSRRGWDIVQLQGGMRAWRSEGLPEVTIPRWSEPP